MGKPIGIDVPLSQAIEIDGAPMARRLGLEVAEFRRLMEQGRIAVLCERGTGEHAGLYRVSFYHGAKRARVVVNGNGEPVSHAD